VPNLNGKLSLKLVSKQSNSDYKAQ